MYGSAFFRHSVIVVVVDGGHRLRLDHYLDQFPSPPIGIRKAHLSFLHDAAALELVSDMTP
jgi:hypothetical protein